jgi:hypothetical protein
MKTTKLALALFILALFAAPASAQYVTAITIDGGTNNVAAATTNTVSYTIATTRNQFVAVQPVFKLTGSGTSAVVFKFEESLDRTNWVTSSLSVSVTAAGTSTVSGIGTLTVNGVGWLKLVTIENPNANAVTNLTLIAATKRPQ